jgi:hypothetical protein
VKTNLESRYLFLKRFTAYYPSTVFLRNSIIQIAKEHELITIRGLIYTTNKVFIFLVVSSCTISIIEAIYFFATEKNEKLKLRFSSIIYLLSLDFNLILFIKFTFKFLSKVVKKSITLLDKLIFKFPILIKYVSIRSTLSFAKVFFLRVTKSSTNIFILPITGSAFVVDKFLEPIEIRWFYRSLPITHGSPFLFY